MIKPIDLQTLFVKMDEVSKEQSAAKEQAALRQEQAARIQVTRELEEDRKVTGTPDESGVIKENESGTQQDTRHQHHRKSKQKKDEHAEVIRDPDVGRHIDLEG